MRLGISLPQFGPGLGSARQIAEFAASAERLGYDTLWVGDRLLTPLAPGDPYPGKAQPYPPEFTRAGDPLLVWTAAATATTRIRLNSSTLNAPYYGHVPLARALTTLDVLSEGRLDVGFGLGWMRDEYAANGVDWATRGRRLDDMLDFLHAWWTTNPVRHHSPYLDLDDAQVDLRPVQPGGPPVYLGGFGGPALRRVGRRAAGWLAVGRLPASVQTSMWDTIRRAAESAGRDPESIRRAVRLNPAPDVPVPELADDVNRAAAEGADEAFVDLNFAGLSPEAFLDRAGELAGFLQGASWSRSPGP